MANARFRSSATRAGGEGDEDSPAGDRAVPGRWSPEAQRLAALLAATGDGDKQAFSELYQATSAKLYGFAIRILKEEGAAQDCIQESYVRIWEHAGQYCPERRAPLTWMGVIVRRRALDMLRRRFERWLGSDADLRSRVERWELQLGSFIEDVDPHTPPSGTWQGILQEVDPRESEKAPVRNHPSLWNHLPLWRGAAIAATVLFAATLAWSLGSSPEPSMPERMAVVNSQDNDPLWVIAASRDSRTVQVRTVRSAHMGPDQIGPLWLRTEDAEKPRMVGILPQEEGIYTLQLPRDVSASLDRSELMVSIETKGQMPVDRPRGQVMYRGDWIHL